MGRFSGLLVLELIEGRSVGARTALLEVAWAELLVLELATEVVVNVGRAVSVLVSDGALPLVSVRSELVLLVACAELLLAMTGGWEDGRPVRYRGCLQS